MGICDAAVLERARGELYRRKDAGFADTMQFTYRNPDRSTDPLRTLPSARSIVVGARSYAASISATQYTVEQSGHPQARIAAYARADHYSDLRLGLEAVANTLRACGHEAVVIADENNLVDREVAWKAGLGWFGKNANLLLPGAGSWFVLGSVITSADLGRNGHEVADGCGSCHRCIDACPTGAIVADGVIDARRCLAWLVQKSGEFPHEHRVALGDRLYGCDDCQDSCPITVRLGSRRSSSRQTPRANDRTALGSHVDVLDVLEADDVTLMDRFGRWYIPDRDPTWVRRNALIILGNVAPLPLSARARAVVQSYAQSSNPYLRAQSLWSAHRLGAEDVVQALATDEDPVVTAEWARLETVPQRIGVAVLGERDS